MCQRHTFANHSTVLRRVITVSVRNWPQGDDNWLSPVAGWTTFSGLYSHGNTLTPSHAPAERITPPFPPPSSLTTPLLNHHHHHQTLSCYSSWIMQEAFSIVATNMPRHVLFTLKSDRSPLAAARIREPPVGLKDISIGSVCLLAQSPWPAHPRRGERIPVFNGSTELEVNICI